MENLKFPKEEYAWVLWELRGVKYCISYFICLFFYFFIFFHLFILLIPGFLILGAMQIKQINIPYSQEFII